MTGNRGGWRGCPRLSAPLAPRSRTGQLDLREHRPGRQCAGPSLRCAVSLSAAASSDPWRPGGAVAAFETERGIYPAGTLASRKRGGKGQAVFPVLANSKMDKLELRPRALSAITPSFLSGLATSFTRMTPLGLCEDCRRELEGEAFGVRRLVAAFRRRLVAVECGGANDPGKNVWFR